MSRSRGGLLQEAERHERVNRERGVAQPAVPVVPVPAAAQFLRQRRGGRRDQRPRGVVDEELEHQRRPLDHLAPSSPVTGLADPVLPEVRREGEQPLGLSPGQRAYLPRPFQLDVDRLPLLHREARGDPGFLDLQRHVGPQHAAPAGGPEDGARSGQELDGVRSAAIVERRVAGQLEGGPAADRAGLADEQVAGLSGAAGVRHHEVDHLTDGFRAVEPGQQNVRIGQVKLPGPPAGAAGQGEVAALAGVQERPEQRGRVKAGRAIPVDRTVRPDERHGAQVPDDAVFLDRQVARRRRLGPMAVADGKGSHSSIIRGRVTPAFHP